MPPAVRLDAEIGELVGDLRVIERVRGPGDESSRGLRLDGREDLAAQVLAVDGAEEAPHVLLVGGEHGRIVAAPAAAPPPPYARPFRTRGRRPARACRTP